MKLVILDTETGGLDASENSLLSVGAVVWDDGELRDRLYFMVNEGNINANPKALAINGLTIEEVQKEGVSPREAVMLLRQWLAKNDFIVQPGKVTMGGHNVAFDADFIDRLYRLAGQRNPFSYRRICTQSAALFLMAAGRLPGVASTSLDMLTAKFGIAIREGGVEGRHNALEDAVATAKLLTKLMGLVTGGEPDGCGTGTGVD